MRKTSCMCALCGNCVHKNKNNYSHIKSYLVLSERGAGGLSRPRVLGLVAVCSELGGERGSRGDVPRFRFLLLARGARETSPSVKPALVAWKEGREVPHVSEGGIKAVRHLVKRVKGMFYGRGCPLHSAQDTGGEEWRGRGRGGGQPLVSNDALQSQPAVCIHCQQTLNQLPCSWRHALPLRPLQGELAGLDPFHDLFSTQTLTIERGVATEHCVLQWNTIQEAPVLPNMGIQVEERTRITPKLHRSHDSV